MSHAPTVRKTSAMRKRHEFNYLRWSAKLISGQSGKKLSSELSSKGRSRRAMIPWPICWEKVLRWRPSGIGSDVWWPAGRRAGECPQSS
jgi:hypothetical protein